MDEEREYHDFDKTDAQRHVQAIIDQAELIMRPAGFEVLAGEWQTPEGLMGRILVSYQRDYGSAFESIVIMLSETDARAMQQVLGEVLALHNDTE